MLLDDPLISERYFFPRPDPPEDPTRIDVESAVLQVVHRPGSPTLLHFHGNGEVAGDWTDLAEVIEGQGYGCLLAEYRGYGGSSGRPQLAAMLEDALAQHDRIEGPVVVYGRSVGSLYAIHVAAHRPVKALLLESGIADLYQRLALRIRPSELDLDALRSACSTHFDHQAKLARVSCPVTVLHAVHDDLVLPDHAVRNAAWAGTEPVWFEQGDHNSIWAYNAGALLEHILRALSAAASP